MELLGLNGRVLQIGSPSSTLIKCLRKTAAHGKVMRQGCSVVNTPNDMYARWCLRLCFAGLTVDFDAPIQQYKFWTTVGGFSLSSR